MNAEGGVKGGQCCADVQALTVHLQALSLVEWTDVNIATSPRSGDVHHPRPT